MNNPHIVQSDRDALDDLGLVDNDNTELLTSRKPPAGTEGSQSELPTRHLERKS